jgi:hypothetical protein
MTALVFADRDNLLAWMTSLGGDEIARDEENFIDRAKTQLTGPSPARPCFVVVVGGAPTSMSANAARAACRRPMPPAVKPPGVRVVTRTHPG